MAHFRTHGLAMSFGGAFLQQLNLRYCSDAVRSFVLSPRFGRIASRPAASTRTGTRTSSTFRSTTPSPWGWMPLVDCSLDMGPLRFVAGSHKFGNLEGMSISEESNASSTTKWPATSQTPHRRKQNGDDGT